MRKMLSVNAKGYLLGEDHPRAKLSDAQVDSILELLDAGEGHGNQRARSAAGLSQAKIAERFGVSRRLIRDIASGRRRGQIADHYVSRASRDAGAFTREHTVHLPSGITL